MPLFSKKQSQPVTDDLKSITENLYKQNHEIALKNKTLSLLSKLYGISILTLSSPELAKRITKTIQEDLSFESVSILLYDQEKDELRGLAFSGSERIKTIRDSLIKKAFNEIAIPKVSSIKLFEPVFKSRIMAYTEQLTDIWGSVFPAEVYKKIQEDGHVRSSLVYPLVIEDHVVGVLMFSLNRLYSDLIEYEKESISSFVNVIAVALDKAMIYEQLKITNAKLEELNKQKTEFISLATHQIRAPLSAIKGFGSMILEGDYGPATDEVKDAVANMYQSAHNLVGVVGDYLDISRIELGKMKYDFTPIKLNPTITQLIAELQPNLRGKDLVLTYKPKDPAEEGLISADLGKVKQVVGNLIDNAIKYTPKGSITVGLERKADNKLLISLVDTGIGIDQYTIPKLFQRFSRADDAHNTNLQGTGLGLYLVRQMVEAQNGKVWVESAGKDKGSQFYIEFPALQK